LGKSWGRLTTNNYSNWGVRWWCFIIAPPCITKDHEYEQDHIKTKLKPLNEQNTINNLFEKEHNIMINKYHK
jgi:hypothetical protein